jgi:hypothetical protein
MGNPRNVAPTCTYKGNLSIRNTKCLILGKGEGDLVPLWTLFLRNYKGDFGLDLFYDEEKTGFRRVHKEGRCNSLTQRGCIQKEPARYMKTQAGTGLGSVPSGNSFVFKKTKAISTGPVSGF